jgi:hypothetical protein
LTHDDVVSTDRETALAELRQWGTPGRRAALIARAWLAGETNVKALAEAAGVSRPTVYADLTDHGIDPAADRPREEIPMYAPITVDGYTGNEPAHTQYWVELFHQQHPEEAQSLQEESSDPGPFFAWVYQETDKVNAARYHNAVAPIVRAQTESREVAWRAMRRVGTAWQDLRTATAAAWPAARLRYVEAVHDAREALGRWADDAAELARQTKQHHPDGTTAYAKLVPDGPSLAADTDTAALVLTELEETHRRRQAILTEATTQTGEPGAESGGHTS